MPTMAAKRGKKQPAAKLSRTPSVEVAEKQLVDAASQLSAALTADERNFNANIMLEVFDALATCMPAGLRTGLVRAVGKHLDKGKNASHPHMARFPNWTPGLLTDRLASLVQLSCCAKFLGDADARALDFAARAVDVLARFPNVLSTAPGSPLRVRDDDKTREAIYRAVLPCFEHLHDEEQLPCEPKRATIRVVLRETFKAIGITDAKHRDALMAHSDV